MAQGWFAYLLVFPGFALIVGLVLFLRKRDTLMHKQLREIRSSQAELLRKVSGTGLSPEPEPEFPEAPKFRLPSQDPSGLSRAETELLTKVRAVRSAGESSGDHAG
jgi:hypothetical protein